MATQESFADWYKQAYAGFPQEHRAAGASEIEMFFAQQDGHESVDDMGGIHGISLATSGTQVSACWNFGDGPKQAWHNPGALLVQPAGTAPHMKVEGQHEIIVLTFPDRIIGSFLATPPLKKAFLTRLQRI